MISVLIDFHVPELRLVLVAEAVEVGKVCRACVDLCLCTCL